MQVRAINDCFIEGGRYVKKGEEFPYTGPKNENLVPTKKAKADADLAEAEAAQATAEAEKAAAEAEEQAAKEKAAAAAAGPSVGA